MVEVNRILFQAAMVDKVSKVVASISKNIKKLSKKAVKDLEKIDPATAKMSKGFSKLRIASIAAVGALAGVGAIAFQKTIVASIRRLEGFQRQMNVVGAITRATGKDFKALQDLALKLGGSTIFSASQASEAMTNLARSGKNTIEIFTILPKILDVAAAGQLSLANASRIVQNVLAVSNLEADKAGKVTDILAATSSRSRTTIEGLGKSFELLAGTQRDVGLTLEQTSSLLAIIGERGIIGSRAGTSLASAFSSLVKPTVRARKVLKKLGVSILDGSGKIKNFIKFMKELEDANISVTQKAVLFEKRGLRAVNAILTEGVDKLRDFEGGLSNVKGEAARLAEEFQIGLVGAFKRLESATDKFLILFARTFEPAVLALVNALTFSINLLAPALERGSIALKTIAASLGLLTIAAGLAIVALGPIGLVIGSIIVVIGTFIAVVNTLSAIFGSSKSAIDDLSLSVAVSERIFKGLTGKVKEFTDQISIVGEKSTITKEVFDEMILTFNNIGESIDEVDFDTAIKKLEGMIKPGSKTTEAFKIMNKTLASTSAKLIETENRLEKIQKELEVTRKAARLGFPTKSLEAFEKQLKKQIRILTVLRDTQVTVARSLRKVEFGPAKPIVPIDFDFTKAFDDVGNIQRRIKRLGKEIINVSQNPLVAAMQKTQVAELKDELELLIKKIQGAGEAEFGFAEGVTKSIADLIKKGDSLKLLSFIPIDLSNQLQQITNLGKILGSVKAEADAFSKLFVEGILPKDKFKEFTDASLRVEVLRKAIKSLVTELRESEIDLPESLLKFLETIGKVGITPIEAPGILIPREFGPLGLPLMGVPSEETLRLQVQREMPGLEIQDQLDAIETLKIAHTDLAESINISQQGVADTISAVSGSIIGNFIDQAIAGEFNAKALASSALLAASGALKALAIRATSEGLFSLAKASSFAARAVFGDPTAAIAAKLESAAAKTFFKVAGVAALGSIATGIAGKALAPKRDERPSFAGGGRASPGAISRVEERPIAEVRGGGGIINITVVGFVGNEQELGSALAPIIRQAVGDDVDFGLNVELA